MNVGSIVFGCKTCDELRRQLEWTRKLCDVLLAKNSIPQVEEVSVEGEVVEIDQEILKGNKEVYGE